MKIKRTLVFIAALAIACSLSAQRKAVRIESPIVSEKDFVWYTEQKEAWKVLAQKDPTNEKAWLNYYNAARYMSWFQQKDSTAKQVVREMEQMIPNSYTFNFCAYRESVQGKGYGDPKTFAEAALAKLPDEMQFFDFDNWVCYLAMQGDEMRMKPLAKRYFNSGIYSEAVLRYSYNELAGMDEGGIYIANGDAAIIPKWLIQEGMGMHKDKTIVCAPFLAVKEYRDWLCKKLSVVDPIHEEPYWTDESCNALLQAIIDKYGSKVYFSTTTPSSTMEPWKNNLYNEGLLLKYSKKPYDNLAVKRRIVEERYMLEYLLVSFRPEWTAGQRLSANYAVLLADLLPYYAKHDQKRYDWLMRILVSGIDNTSMSEERKQEFRSLLIEK
ncbi:MAG: hypothetical protein IKQ05_03300 [Prevotella sp.]|nr:hypothetical protein [Prevotella sp.]